MSECGMTTVALPVSLSLSLPPSSSPSPFPSPPPKAVQAQTEDDNSPYPPIPADKIEPVRSGLERMLTHEYGTFVPIFVYGGGLWLRASAQVYLEVSDFEWLGEALLELLRREGEKGWVMM